MDNNEFYWQRYRWRGIWTSSQIFKAIFVNNTAQTTKFVPTGAIYANNKHSHVYYMVVSSSSQYKLQENNTIYGQVIESDELVSNRRYFSPTIKIQDIMLLQ